jgi:molybdopterin/thiamine biosynthesis adenylyltransferase
VYDTKRIGGAISRAIIEQKRVLAVGCGAMAGLCRDLVRCGVGAIDPCDFDLVSFENICRQEHATDQIGQYKVFALEAELKRINPGVRVRPWEVNICQFDDDQVREVFHNVDLFVAGTDSHAAQARVNQIALMLNKPMVMAGMYRAGRAGDVYFWKPGLPSCYRCVYPNRYAAFERGQSDPPSDGATIMDVKILDSIAAQVAVGLLTDGADNRFGRLIGTIGNRQVLQIKIDPDWSFNGADPVRTHLGVRDDADGYVSFCTAARRDPEPGGVCPDCVRYRSDGRPDCTTIAEKAGV